MEVPPPQQINVLLDICALQAVEIKLFEMVELIKTQ